MATWRDLLFISLINWLSKAGPYSICWEELPSVASIEGGFVWAMPPTGTKPYATDVAIVPKTQFPDDICVWGSWKNGSTSRMCKPWRSAAHPVSGPQVCVVGGEAWPYPPRWLVVRVARDRSVKVSQAKQHLNSLLGLT